MKFEFALIEWLAFGDVFCLTEIAREVIAPVMTVPDIDEQQRKKQEDDEQILKQGFLHLLYIRTNRTCQRIMPSGRTVFPPKVNDLQMKFIPYRLGK